MKTIKKRAKIILLSLLLVSSVYAYSGTVAPCLNIIKHFNKPALAALYENKQNLQITLSSNSSRNTAGCFVETTISYTDGAFNQVSKDIGSILVYQVPESRAIYEEDKQAFMPQGAKLNWQGIMPYVEEGYVSNAMAGYQSFNAYLTNGEYVIFIYQHSQSERPTNTQLSQAFINYINVMAAQVVNN